jgi:hypothetical protein
MANAIVVNNGREERHARCLTARIARACAGNCAGARDALGVALGGFTVPPVVLPAELRGGNVTASQLLN